MAAHFFARLEQEDETVRRACSGDPEAFAALVDFYAPLLLTLAWRVLGNRDDAWDSVQEGLVAAWKGLRKFRGDSGFYPWVRAIVLRQAIRYAGRRSRESRRLTHWESLPEMALPAEADPSELALKRIQHNDLWRAVGELPAHYRAVFWLREAEDLSYEEIAEAMHIPVGTVRSRLAQARKRLRMALGGDR